MGRLDIDKMSAALGSGTVTGKLSVSNFANPSIAAQFEGSMNLAEIKDYYPLEEGTDLRGALRADVALKGRAMKPETIQAQGSIEFREVSIRSPATRNPLDELNGDITFNNDLEADLVSLEAYAAFRREAASIGMRHFLEVFNPNAPSRLEPEKVAAFVNDSIVRALAGVTEAHRPLFLKLGYNGAEALEELTEHDPSLVVGVYGGTAGTTRDTFELLHRAHLHVTSSSSLSRRTTF